MPLDLFTELKKKYVVRTKIKVKKSGVEQDEADVEDEENENQK